MFNALNSSVVRAMVAYDLLKLSASEIERMPDGMSGLIYLVLVDYIADEIREYAEENRYEWKKEVAQITGS